MKVCLEKSLWVCLPLLFNGVVLVEAKLGQDVNDGRRHLQADPTASPTAAPTMGGTTFSPTSVPSGLGSTTPPTGTGTLSPTIVGTNTAAPTPTDATGSPTTPGDPTASPTDEPTESPTESPTKSPTIPGFCPTPLLEPIVAGVREGTNGTPHIVLAMGVGEPPYTQLGEAMDGFPLSGFVVDVGLGLSEVCSIEIEFSQAPQGTCFTTFGIADRLAEGAVHGCANYLKTPGNRERQAEFTLPLVDNRTPSALLTRLDSNGEPVITGLDDLANKTIVDVPGVVPNPEELAQAVNPCTGELFASPTLVNSNLPGVASDAALRYLLNGNADGLWINAVAPESFSCANVPNGTTPDYDCKLWDGLGTTYAFVHTGIPSTALTGATLAMSKKGSGLSKILDPCIKLFLETQQYLDLCLKYDLVANGVCFRNAFFPEIMLPPEDPLWSVPTDALNTTCADGYCACPSS